MTLEAGHQITVVDNDYLIVIDDGSPNYRYESATWYRWLGAVRNTTAGVQDHYANAQQYDFEEGSDQTTADTTMGDVANTKLEIITMGGDVVVAFHGNVKISSASANIRVEISLDGADGTATPDAGYIYYLNPDNAAANKEQVCSFERYFPDLLPGSHAFTLRWRVSAGTATMMTTRAHQFWAREVADSGMGV